MGILLFMSFIVCVAPCIVTGTCEIFNKYLTSERNDRIKKIIIRILLQLENVRESTEKLLKHVRIQ